MKTGYLIAIIFALILISLYGWRIPQKYFLSEDKNTLDLAERLKKHVYELSFSIGDRNIYSPQKLKAAKDYIASNLQSLGYATELQTYQVNGETATNIIATKKGYANFTDEIVIGAHYDTCFNPGADDNGSGVATLLELARALQQEHLNKTIKFIAFTNEEPPFFKSKKMGSYVYAENARAKQEKIEVALILESVGYYSNKPFSQKYPPFFGFFYPNKGNFIAIISDFNSNHYKKKIAKILQQNSQIKVESVATFPWVIGVDFSDHWSFWQFNYKAVMITDTAFYRNPYYHTLKDHYETLNYSKMANLCRGLKEVIIKLANS